MLCEPGVCGVRIQCVAGVLCDIHNVCGVRIECCGVLCEHGVCGVKTQLFVLFVCCVYLFVRCLHIASGLGRNTPV